ncbi:uncharacterized protein ColSpa_00867 [Colletotrichum spaethianum]|uniref:Uncharacterized protein n=1 Tax=Colletotrichum spaethianum TaxID=700344 RepID=A0AA37P4A6_9PEZI|nr:uncharacterized protein ColSpa_00867 [Colletotrichum spaethianum]GKT40686.1 hypothetical protein ColSpa_00867 [Colletotrichum spaethianum]
MSGDSLSSFFFFRNIYYPVEGLTRGVELFIRADIAVLSLSMVIWGAVSIFDLYRTGLSNFEPVQGVAWFLVGSVVVGPGAALHGLWTWREHLMAKKTFGHVSKA